MICDFAQTYGILDWRALPLHTAATLCAGLGPGSRAEGARAGLRVPKRDFIAALIADRLALLLRFLRSDETQPYLFAPELLSSWQEPEEKGQFENSDDFEAWRAERLKRE